MNINRKYEWKKETKESAFKKTNKNCVQPLIIISKL